ncbi:MAG: hypothetical protein LBL83_02035, partial [Clostridiales bacterium]|nr:hypothetical protein [Clostridiales bacterium]
QHGRARFSVDRYKGADGIVADILKIYTARDGAIPDAELMQANRAGHAALVYSACGGAGRTTFAIGLCAHFAGMGQKTLYLNLDWTGVEPLAFDMASATGMTDVVFYLKTKPERLGSRLEALRQTNAGAAFDYFAPPDYPMDIDELAPAETELLVGKLRGSGMYDKIVIDTHCGLSMRNKALLDLADSVLILSEADALSLKKLSLAKQQLDRSFADLAPSIYKKCAIAINKCPRAGASGGAGARVDGAGSSYAGYTGYAGHTGADTGADSAGASCASAGAAHAGAALANAAHAGTGAGAGDLSEGWGADAGAGALLGHAREISRMFGTNVHIVPFCAGIDAGSLCAACSPAGSADGFGASVSSIARAIDSAGRGGAAYAKRGQ